MAGVTDLSSFQAGDAGWHLGTLGAGQLDADSELEIVIPYRNADGTWYLDAYNPNGARLPGFPFYGGSSEINASPTLYDLDGNGLDEIIFTCGTRVIVLHANGTVLWSSEVTPDNYVPDSGFMTVANGFHWSSTGELLARLPQTAVFSSQVSSPIVADFAGDGQKQIITAWKIDPDSTSSDQDFNPFINDLWGSGEWGTMGESWSGGVVFFNAANGARDYTYHIPQLVESGLALGRPTAGARLNTYVLNDSDSVVCFDKSKPHGLFGSGNLHGQFGKNQRLMSGAYQQGVDVYTADIDGDGRSEVLVPTTQLNPLWQPHETVLDDDGAILWRKWKQAVSFPLNQWQNSAGMIPINPDRDNRIDVLCFTHSYEIAFRTWNGVELADRPGWPKNFFPLLPTPPVVGDVDGDGQEEIVIGTYNPSAQSGGDLLVFALDGTLEHSVPVPGGLKHIPTIANVYGTGLCVVYRSLSGRVYIKNFGSTTAGPVSWATHRGSKHRDGHFDRPLFAAGSPVITSRQGGQRRANFSWSLQETNTPDAFRIYRAERPEGPFHHIMTVAAAYRTFTDLQLESGSQYIYEVAAVYDSRLVHSAPFAIVTTLNGNLISNGGFEENSDSHWDKWFTGEIDFSNMTTSTNVAFQGRQSMEIRLQNHGNNGSISQFGQYGTPTATLPVRAGTLYSFGGFFKTTGLSQNTAHWFEWSSTITAGNTNSRPWRPYPSYFTPHFKPGTAPSQWTYANRTFVMPEGFPNIEFTHWFTAEFPASGSLHLDGLFFRPLPALSATNWITLIPFGAQWRFSATAVANWFATGFADTAWPLGIAKFGAGGGPANVATPLLPGLPAYHFRRTFTVPDEPCEELLLSATCTDEGVPMEVYLNGIRLNTTGVEATSAQGNAVQHYDLAPFLHLLRPGNNVIAIALANVSQPGWDDVAFDVSLRTICRPENPMRMSLSHVPANSGATASVGNPAQIGLNITVPPQTIWRVESADGLSAPWQFMAFVSNSVTGSILLPDHGQNGRSPTSLTPQRFYRISPR